MWGAEPDCPAPRYRGPTVGKRPREVNSVSSQCTHTAPIDTPSTSPNPALNRASNEWLKVGSVPGEEEAGGLDVGHQGHLGPLRMHAAAERQPDGDDEHRAAAHQVRADAEHQRAVERKVRRLVDDALARFNAEQRHALSDATGIEDAALEPDVELAARHPVDALEGRAAAVGKAQQRAELGARERPIRRVERRGARSLRGRIPDAGHSQNQSDRDHPSHRCLQVSGGRCVQRVPAGGDRVPPSTTPNIRSRDPSPVTDVGCDRPHTIAGVARAPEWRGSYDTRPELHAAPVSPNLIVRSVTWTRTAPLPGSAGTWSWRRWCSRSCTCLPRTPASHPSPP